MRGGGGEWLMKGKASILHFDIFSNLQMSIIPLLGVIPLPRIDTEQILTTDSFLLRP